VAAWAAGWTVRSWRHKSVALERANRGLRLQLPLLGQLASCTTWWRTTYR